MGTLYYQVILSAIFVSTNKQNVMDYKFKWWHLLVAIVVVVGSWLVVINMNTFYVLNSTEVEIDPSKFECNPGELTKIYQYIIDMDGEEGVGIYPMPDKYVNKKKFENPVLIPRKELFPAYVPNDKYYVSFIVTEGFDYLRLSVKTNNENADIDYLLVVGISNMDKIESMKPILKSTIEIGGDTLNYRYQLYDEYVLRLKK